MVAFAPFLLAQAILFASMAAALPLNINLGAYSPAIVVGDGAIGFSGGKAGTEEALAAAAAKAGTGSTVISAAPAVGTVAASKSSPGAAVVQASAADPSILSAPASLPVPGSHAKELDPRL